MATIDSLDNLINACNLDGSWRAFYGYPSMTATTAALATCGYVTAQHYPRLITVPTFGGSVTKAYLSYFKATAENQPISIGCYKMVSLGSINIGTGTFTDGSTMGTGTIRGSSITLGSSHLFAVVTTALTGTAVTLTITYTDDSGNTGNSCAPVLPAAPAVGSAFFCNPHFASGDCGVQDITACTRSGGTAGVVTFYGCLELGRCSVTSSTANCPGDPVFGVGRPIYPLSSADKIGFISFGNATATDFFAEICLVPER